MVPRRPQTHTASPGSDRSRAADVAPTL